MVGRLESKYTGSEACAQRSFQAKQEFHLRGQRGRAIFMLSDAERGAFATGFASTQ
jgi:hypothetical protein